MQIETLNRKSWDWQEPRPKRTYNVNSYIRRYKDKLFPQNIDPIKNRLIDHILMGRTNTELMELFECGKDSIKAEKAGIRKKIEEIYMTPRNLQYLSSIDKRKTLVMAARNGALDSVFFMGRWYTTDQAVEKYFNPPKPEPALPSGQIWAIPHWVKK